MTYYNTNIEAGLVLTNSQRIALNQNQLVLEVFTQNANIGFTPDEVHDIVPGYGPITSIRRAISTLTKDGKLTKTEELRKGMWGKQTHVWRLNDQTT